MIVALAGRRVDPSQTTEARFPVANSELVTSRLRNLFVARHARVLICAAACGADLLALELAGEMGMSRRVVLPFPRDEFRRKSVADRGGNWGERYDRVLDELQGSGSVTSLPKNQDDRGALRHASAFILDEAVASGTQLHQPVLAVAVWNMKSRGPDDMTEHFLREAAKRGIEVAQIPTL